VGSHWQKAGERWSGWRVWLRRAAHHFLPEDPAPLPTPSEPSAAASTSNTSTGPGAQTSLDHVLRTAAEARATQETAAE
jgi:hypothetical protein